VGKNFGELVISKFWQGKLVIDNQHSKESVDFTA